MADIKETIARINYVLDKIDNQKWVPLWETLTALRDAKEILMTRDRLTQFSTKQYNGGIIHQEGGTT